MEHYEIVLSPNLDLSLVDFIDAWNEEVETSDKGKVHLEPSIAFTTTTLY